MTSVMKFYGDLEIMVAMNMMELGYDPGNCKDVDDYWEWLLS